MVTKQEIMDTATLEEAVQLLFRVPLPERMCLLAKEAMEGDLAREYDELGRNARSETYQKIAEDFKRRTGCYGMNYPANSFGVGSILEVGCGSGLLTLELAEKTNSSAIVGLDISDDMIQLAHSNLSRRKKEKIDEVNGFLKKLPPSYVSNPDDFLDSEERSFSVFDRINYMVGSVYDLQKIPVQGFNYIVCRNALHRFQFPEKALAQMYSALTPEGKIYLRDLRRDAHWKTVLGRIGEKRWQTKTLVEDYIAAMASMFTPEELEKTISSLGISHFEISDGRYLNGNIQKSKSALDEYERETEYVCVIRK